MQEIYPIVLRSARGRFETVENQLVTQDPKLTEYTAIQKTPGPHPSEVLPSVNFTENC